MGIWLDRLEDWVIGRVTGLNFGNGSSSAYQSCTCANCRTPLQVMASWHMTMEQKLEYIKIP